VLPDDILRIVGAPNALSRHSDETSHREWDHVRFIQVPRFIWFLRRVSRRSEHTLPSHCFANETFSAMLLQDALRSPTSAIRLYPRLLAFRSKTLPLHELWRWRQERATTVCAESPPSATD
jgi:hypothetical protein